MLKTIDKNIAEYRKNAELNEKKRRKFIWEIDGMLPCSVCGTCLSLKEQRNILKKLKFDCKEMNDYEIHGIMVQSCAAKNKVSYQLDKLLNQKYRHDIALYADLDEKGFVDVWREHLKTGDVCGLYWVAATHPGISFETMHILFCEVHMLSHLNGGTVRKEKADYQKISKHNQELSKKLKTEKKNNRRLSEQLQAEQEKRMQLEARLSDYNQRLEDIYMLENVQKELSLMQSRNQALEEQVCRLQEQLQQSAQESIEYKHLIRQNAKEKETLLDDLSVQEDINNELYREISKILDQFNCTAAPCGKSPEEQSLCAKKVLIIGGLTKMKEYYRDLIEKEGGAFEYHDGHLHAGEKALEEQIKRSDIILCPTDFNSHGACYSVKKICKRLNKPYQILPGSSLNCISRALSEPHLKNEYSN
ncbi:MAG: DUF2325 domain-containing protein [Bacillota bacterium]|nr:DUF2325 domain-containing protein [Bacillota bacterium]